MSFKDSLSKACRAIKSRRGRNFIAFSVFFVIATILWWVTALNDEGQTDLRMPVKITHMPDSVTIISKVPASLSVSVMGRGAKLLKYNWSKTPELKIDFRIYNDGSAIHLSTGELKSIARSALSGAQIAVVSPDSLNLIYTTQPPIMLPVKVDCRATPGPQVTLSGEPIVTPDTVKVYVAGHNSIDAAYIAAEPVRMNEVNSTVSRRVKLIAPAHSRVIPDSVTVTVKAEALIFKTRRVRIDTENVPAGMRLITFPSQVDVMYMIPVSDYLDAEPYIRVVADYHSIDESTGKVRLRVAEASSDLQNVQCSLDSAEYIIERHD